MRAKDFGRRPLYIFCSYFKPHWRMFAADMLCSLAAAGVDLVFPLASRAAMQKLLPDRLFGAFFAVMAVMAAAYLVKAVLYYVITVVGHRMGTCVEADMRQDIFRHMQTLSFSFYDKNRTGVLMSRVTNDLFEIVELAHHGPENLLICTVTVVGALAILASVNWQLSLILLVAIPVCVGYTMVQRVAMQRANVEVKRKVAEINAAIESGISGIRTAKAFANEQTEDDKFAASNENYKRAKVGYYRAMGRFNGGIEFSMGIMQVIVIAAGGLMIMQGKLDYVGLVTFTLYVTTFISPIRKLAQFMETYTQGAAGFSRFLEIMRTEPDIKDAKDAVELKNVKGEIRYEHVCFAYDTGEEVLRDINLTVRAGETFALVGPSGGGKTTLCHLLPRFYDVTSGRITVDGTDIRSVTQESLRRNIGIIAQDVFMFAGTVRENIRYGRPDASDSEVVEAAVRAEIHKEIMELPDGYDTYIGERGVMLSGGQKQRIAIARVFLKNPPVLILDEATSALDSVTEQRIQASLDRLAEGRTCIIIAHRLSTIRSAARIAVIDGEHIAEEGTHEALLSQNGLYAALSDAQKL